MAGVAGLEPTPVSYTHLDVYKRQPMDGVVPENFYATSIFPEYFKINGHWILIRESRMDCVVVLSLIHI